MTDNSTTPEDTGTAHAARKVPPSGRAADEQAWKDHHASLAEPLAAQNSLRAALTDRLAMSPGRA